MTDTPATCAHCGGLLYAHGEVVEDFCLPGKCCSPECLREHLKKSEESDQ